jgi:hypothetical protein
MTVTEKAKKLYLECNNTDPDVNMLMPFKLPIFKGKNIQHGLFVAQLISKYALDETEEDEWIEFSRESFYIPKGDKESWTSLKSTCYRLEKKGFVETKSENGFNYVRLTNNNDEIFNPESYKHGNTLV